MHHTGDGWNSTATRAAKIQIGSRCADSACSGQGIVILAGHDFCLEHFLAKCYERLDLIEPVVRSRHLDAQDALTARALLKECANQALLVCLRHQPTDNLQRSRLLDILLQCGDLQIWLDRPTLQLT